MTPGGGVPAFQNVLLNVQSVRINPNPDAGPGSAKWQNIAVPPGIGGAGQAAELQIDLNASQNIPQLFNTGSVRADTYRVAELRLDPNNPGTIVPNCPQGPPLGHNTSDGCINYPIQLSNGLVITASAPGNAPLVSPGSGKIAPLVLQISMTIQQAPTGPGGAYVVAVTMAPVSTSVLGSINGSVKVTGSGSGTVTKKTRKLAVTAEAIGTGIPIASANVKNGNYTLFLPAASGAAPPGFGTLYDLAVAGGGDTYAATRLPPLYPNTSQTANFTVTNDKMIGNITGTILDGCTTNAIVGATLELLIPPDSISSPPSGFCVTSPDQCVVVATANTDNAGDFPLPGTITIPAAFDNVPDRGMSNPYALEITAPGYQTTIVQAIPSSTTGKAGGTCAPMGSTTFGPCNFNLPTAYLSGSIPISPPPPGQTTLVQVFAEDHDTNTIESVLPMPISVTSSNPGLVSYTLNVPPTATAPATSFDLFATTIDLYQGSVDPYQGHNIVAISNVAAPGTSCATATVPTPADSIDCVGHGSIIGSVANPNLGTTVVLEKIDPANGGAVQITNSIVQNQQPNMSPSNNYAFCAPADTYQLEEFQLPTPEPSVTPTSMPTPAPVDSSITSVTIPPPPIVGSPTPGPTPIGPTATPTPGISCPTTCSNPDGTCPGICNTVIQPLPAP